MAENRSARNEFPQGFRISGSKNRGSARKITFAFNHDFWLPVCPLVVCVEYIFSDGRFRSVKGRTSMKICQSTDLELLYISSHVCPWV